MKIKCDFVTNSSSCSFVMIGMKTTSKKIKDMLKETYGEDYEYGDYSNDLPNGLSVMFEPEMIGKYIVKGKSDEYGIPSTNLSLEQIQKTIMEVSDILEVEPESIKLYIGERNC